MRILAQAINCSSVFYLKDASINEDFTTAMKLVCDVLEISVLTDTEDLSPSDARAIEGVHSFVQQLASKSIFANNSAYIVTNLNTGKNILFLHWDTYA